MSDQRPHANGNEVIAKQAKLIDDLNKQLRAERTYKIELAEHLTKVTGLAAKEVQRANRAQDEIERLRTILLLDGRLADADKEIERLQSALREAREWLDVYCEEKAYDPIKAIIDAVLSQEPRP